MAKILAVQSFKGGTGKSTITANLAVTLARLGRRVAIVDLDLEGPGLHVIFGVGEPEVRATSMTSSNIPPRSGTRSST